MQVLQPQEQLYDSWRPVLNRMRVFRVITMLHPGVSPMQPTAADEAGLEVESRITGEATRRSEWWAHGELSGDAG